MNNIEQTYIHGIDVKLTRQYRHCCIYLVGLWWCHLKNTGGPFTTAIIWLDGGRKGIGP